MTNPFEDTKREVELARETARREALAFLQDGVQRYGAMIERVLALFRDAILPECECIGPYVDGTVAQWYIADLSNWPAGAPRPEQPPTQLIKVVVSIAPVNRMMPPDFSHQLIVMNYQRWPSPRDSDTKWCFATESDLIASLQGFIS